MKGTRWTQEETDLLKENSTKEKEYILTLFPNRSWKSIRHKIVNSGFEKVNAYERYTKEEDELLKEYSTENQDYLMLKLPSRTWESITYRIDALKLPREKAWELWSPEEESIILKYDTVEEMKEFLPNRTESKIHSKAVKMGKRFGQNYWSEEEVKYLVENYSIKPSEQVAEELGRTVTSIYMKASSLELKSFHFREKITKEEVLELYLEEMMQIKEIANIYNVATNTVSILIPPELKRNNPKIDKKKAIEMYAEGIGTPTIAKLFDTNPNSIINMLKRNNVKMRSSSHYFESYRYSLPVNEFSDLYLYGFSSVEIGSFYNTNGTTVIQRLRENNIAIREDNSFYVSGSKSNYWKGGITGENVLARGKKEYHHWRTSVYERDNYTCQCCEDKRGGNLHAHHINNFSEFEELRHEVSNGISLCLQCHISQFKGSFHNTYGTHNNNIFQLQEYFDDIRSALGLSLIKIEDIIYSKELVTN